MSEKSLSDAELDTVSGGTFNELERDVKFLKKLGIKAEYYRNPILHNRGAIAKAWNEAGDIQVWSGNLHPDKSNNYMKDSKPISRQDAMIYAMRKQNKYLNLEDFI